MNTPTRLLAVSLLAACSAAKAQVRINEFAASSSDKKVVYDAAAVPRMGSTRSWYDPGFLFWRNWETAVFPAGWGVGTPTTNLQAAMQNKTHVIYLRKEFTVSASQAASSDPLKLTVNVNDGFVAYINGVEVARANCGPAKHFLFYEQPAYNGAVTQRVTNPNVYPNTTENVSLLNGPVTYTLGPASNFLVSGTNLIAIEARNSDLSSSFSIDAGLGIGGTLSGGNVVNLTFTNNAGAIATHTNTAGTGSDGAVTGTPATDGWISGTPNPATGNGWANLVITRTESTGEGFLGGGAMKFDLAQTGPTPPTPVAAKADIFGKPVTMSGAWASGAVDGDQVTGTRVKFKYRMSNPNSAYDFRVDANAAPGASLGGFSILGQLPLQQSDWSGDSAIGGNKIFNLGTNVTTSSTTARTLNFNAFRAPNFNGGQFTLAEDPAINGPDGKPGVFRMTVDVQGTLTAVGDSWWGWSVEMANDQFFTGEWDKPNVTTAELAKTVARLRYKITPGRNLGVRLEPQGGGFNERCDLATLVGTGKWETFSMPLSGGGNLTAFLAFVNNVAQANSKRLRFTFYNAQSGNTYPDGTEFLIDELSLDYDRNLPAVADFNPSAATTGNVGIDFTPTPDTVTYNGTRLADVFAFGGPGMTGGALSLVEDNATAGPDGANGVLRLSVTTTLATTTPGSGDYWGYGVFFGGTQFDMTQWAPPNVTMADLMRAKFSFRYKFPLGKRLALRLEPRDVGDGYGNRIELATLTGTGQWETYTGTLGAGVNAAVALTAINSTPTKRFTLLFSQGDSAATYTAGTDFLFDEFSLYEDLGSSSVAPPVENANYTVSGALGGTSVRNNVTNTTVNTSITTPGLGVFADPAAANFIFKLVEDNTVGAGNGGSTGHIKLIVDSPATTTPSYWGGTIMRWPMRNYPAQTGTSGDLAKLMITFSLKIPSGQNVFLWFQPASTGYGQRLELGTFTGTGTWQTHRVSLGARPNEAAFLTAMNTPASVPQVELNFGPSGFASPAGTEIFAIDDLKFDAWRDYDVLLTSGTGSAGFISALNTAGSIAWTPVFSKRGFAALEGEDLIIDKFEVTYTGPLPGNATTLIETGVPGGNWSYTLGLGEPSGGIFDPLLARNVLGVPDAVYEDYDNPGESVDWVELYNEGGAPADISGYGFTDNLAQPAKWTFPAGTIVPANGYLLVCCDKRQLAQPPTDATYPHASFSISASGGDIGLFNDTTAVSTVTYPRQTADRSWSRDAGGAWGYTEGTPNHANSAALIPAVVADPDIFILVSGNPVRGGHFTGGQSVEITCATAGAEIRYTTNGSVPTATSALYSGPIAITAPNTRTGNVVRARAFLAGSKPSAYTTATFLLDQDSRLTGVPVVAFTGDAGRSMYGPHGIMTISGGDYSPLSEPSYNRLWYADSPDDYNIAMADGAPAEREANLEWFTPPGYYTNGQPASQNVGVGLRLSWSPYSRPRGLLTTAATASPISLYDTQNKNSYNIFFRSDFGPDSSINYRFFPNYTVSRFKNMRLRAGKNDIANPFYVDELVRRSWIHMGNQGVKGAIVTNYVNGAYKGYYNLCERIRLPFYQEHFGSTNLWDVRYVFDWEEGDGTFYYSTLYPQVSNPSNPNYDTSIPANYALLAERMDPVETADYFLLNIWASMWDWPGNNFALGRERVAGPQGRFHWTVWDAEGGIGSQNYYKQVDYNTLVKDLINPTANGNGDTELSVIFRSFLRSPQWRRLFADRVQKHLFNDGALDTTAGSSAIHAERNSLVGEITPLFRFANNSTTSNLNETFWNIWLNGGTLDANASGGARTVASRRSYLFPTGNPGDGGYNPGWLRDPNQDGNVSDSLWPVTQAPTFNQYGGTVPGGFNLVMTSPSGKPIYYTLDGSDPATATGGIAGSATLYSSALVLNASVTVRARALDGGTSEWSPISEGAFQVAVASPSAANLVVAEIQYNPVGGDAFEFIRVQNISAGPVDLTKLQFTVGISFIFGTGTGTGTAPYNVPLTELAAGDSVFVVKNVAGFQSRFGTAYNGRIAGNYGTSNLGNGGEQIKLDHVDGPTVTVIKDFIYDDAPHVTSGNWPTEPDGSGPSLLLKDPASNPDHNLAINWTASSTAGGLAGRNTTYTDFQNATWTGANLTNPAISGPGADPDGDGFENLLEFALNMNPLARNSGAVTTQGRTNVSGQDYLTLTFDVRAGVSGVAIVAETSGDLATWTADAVLVGPGTAQPDGSTRYTYRDATPLGGPPDRHFLHVRVTIP